MSEAKRAKAKSEAESAAEADEAERALARKVAIGIPLGTLLAAIGVGVVTSLGPALLVFTAGALLGTITLLWASLRTLGGDAPLPMGLATEAIVSKTNRGVEDRKRTVLLALKDLEHERAIGKISEADYADVSARYREEAKAILRSIDEEAAPNRPRAEQIARAHLKKRGLLDIEASDDSDKPIDKPRMSVEPAPPTTKSSQPPPPMKENRAACEKCGTSNETDAAFCKKCGAPMNKKEKKEEKPEEQDQETSETPGKHAD